MKRSKTNTMERKEMKKGCWRKKENRKKPTRIMIKGINSKCDVEEEKNCQ